VCAGQHGRCTLHGGPMVRLLATSGRDRSHPAVVPNHRDLVPRSGGTSTHPTPHSRWPYVVQTAKLGLAPSARCARVECDHRLHRGSDCHATLSGAWPGVPDGTRLVAVVKMGTSLFGPC